MNRNRESFELTDFGYAYPDERAGGLTDVSVSIDAGEFVVICGDSGSGKSTLLRTAAGLVPHHFGGAVSGEARVCGLDLRDHGPGELAAVCGTVMQDPEVQTVMGNVRNEIAFPLENLGWEAQAIAVAVNETAIALGIEHLLDRRTGELSGGELQRVELAAALAPRPQLLALDEPTSQLDPVAADDLIHTLARLNGDWGTTILIAEHRFERSLEFADRVLLLDGGRLVVDASPATFLAEVAERPDHRYLLPQTAELCDRIGVEPLPTSIKAARRALNIDRESFDFKGVHGSPELESSVTPALSLKKIRHRYPERRRPAVDGVSLDFRAGERVVLMGANGSGKSTLLRIARGVQRADEGMVTATGDIGLLLQNPNDYLIHERVSDEAPAEALAMFGLEGFADRDPRDLSGGERQRLALAIVMQQRPVALLLDEPTRGMDRRRREELANELLAFSEDGVAVIVATHDAEFAARFAERAVLLADGSVMADGDAREVLGGGWHFATDIAKLFPGSGALSVDDAMQSLGVGAPDRHAAEAVRP